MSGFQHQISIVLQVKNLEQVKKQLKDVIPTTASKPVDQFTNKVKQTNEQLGRTPRKARSATDGIRKFTGTVFSSIATLGLFNRGMRTMLNLSGEFGSFQRAGTSFEMVVGNMGQNLDVLRTATRGTVDNLTLLKTATRAVTEGLAKNQLKSVFESATLASRRLGLQTSETVQTISKAITRQDESALSTLGIVLKTNKQYQVMMAQISSLQGATKKAAEIEIRRKVILNEINRLYGNGAVIQADSLEMLEKFQTSWANLRMSLGKVAFLALQPILTFITKINDGLRKFIDFASQSSILQTAIKGLGTAFTILATVITGKALFGLGKLALGFLNVKGGITSILAVGARLIPLLLNITKALSGPIGWLTGIFALLGGFQSIAKAAKLAYHGISLFMDILNFNPTTGFAQVLQEDMDALGNASGPVIRAAKRFVQFKHMAIGALKGVVDYFKTEYPLIFAAIEAVGATFSKLQNVAPSLVDYRRNASSSDPGPVLPSVSNMQDTQANKMSSGFGFGSMMSNFTDSIGMSMRQIVDTAPWNRDEAVPVGNAQSDLLDIQSDEAIQQLKLISKTNKQLLEHEITKDQKNQQSQFVRR